MAGRSIENPVFKRNRSIRLDIFSHGYPAINAVQTILPPNSPSCTTNHDGSARGYYSASSNHSGGVNTLRADGSVFFVSETISCGDQQRDMAVSSNEVTIGPSPFGVWGALGSLNGGESIAI